MLNYSSFEIENNAFHCSVIRQCSRFKNNETFNLIILRNKRKKNHQNVRKNTNINLPSGIISFIFSFGGLQIEGDFYSNGWRTTINNMKSYSYHFALACEWLRMPTQNSSKLFALRKHFRIRIEVNKLDTWYAWIHLVAHRMERYK